MSVTVNDFCQVTTHISEFVPGMVNHPRNPSAVCVHHVWLTVALTSKWKLLEMSSSWAVESILWQSRVIILFYYDLLLSEWLIYKFNFILVMCKVGKQYKLEVIAFCIWILQCALWARGMIPIHSLSTCPAGALSVGVRVWENLLLVHWVLAFLWTHHFICVGMRNCQKIHFSATKITYLNQYRTVIN